MTASAPQPTLPALTRYDTERPASSWSAGAFASAALVTVLAAVVYSWDVGRPGLWRDEAATIATCRRSLGQLFQLTANVDLVHLAYYLLVRIAWQVDPSPTAVRLISVLAMSLTAGLLVLIGRRLGSLRLGVLAGLLLVVNPYASRYAQEARPFAVVTLLATICTYALLALREQPESRRWQVAYGATLALLGLFNVLALMLVLAHAGYVLVLRDSALRRRWAIAAVAGLVVISPFVLAGFTQRGQVAWILRPRPYDLRALFTEEFGSRIAPLVVAAAVLAVLLIRRWIGTEPVVANRAAVTLGATWAVLPPALLWAGSQVVPLWDTHYLLFTVPGLALLLAGFAPGLDGYRFDRRVVAAIVVPVLLLGVLGWHAQGVDRDRLTGHTEDLQSVADYLGAQARTGDAILIVPSELRILTEVYPDDFAKLQDVGIQQTPVRSSTLVGVPLAPGQLAGRLLPHRRVWLVHGLYSLPVIPGSLDAESERLLAQDYQLGASRTVTDVRVTLYTR